MKIGIHLVVLIWLFLTPASARADMTWEAKYSDNACFAFLFLRDEVAVPLDLHLSIMWPNADSGNPRAELLSVEPDEPGFQVQFTIGLFKETQISEVEIDIEDRVIRPIRDPESDERFPIFLIGGPVSLEIYDAFEDGRVTLRFRADGNEIEVRGLKGNGYRTVKGMFEGCRQANAS